MWRGCEAPLQDRESKKAPGLENILPCYLKTHWPTCSKVFKRSLEMGEVPSCLKCVTLLQPSIMGLNQYRPVALTSEVMKSSKWLVLVDDRLVDDTVNIGLHYIWQNFNCPGTYVRILFLDFNLAFNTSIPEIPCRLSVDQQLSERQEITGDARGNHFLYSVSIAAPHDYVLSLLLFHLYTNDCTSTDTAFTCRRLLTSLQSLDLSKIS